jgi:4-diphosphocytidyl-2-C-methyl-D-erythritol kinase
MICFPNGKINLGLNVLSKREDGYHNIESLFYPIPLYDVLEFLPSTLFQLSISGMPVSGPKEDNLVFKAWELLAVNYKVPPLRIHLHKAIPTASGLGGGSADAAFFLQKANDYFKLRISSQKMQKLAGTLGSDCAFFVENKASLASQKGEILQPVNLRLSGKYLLVIKPELTVLSGEAYAWVKPRKPETPISEIISKPIEQWKNLLHNDFEEPLFKRYPEIKEIKNFMYGLGAVYAAMSGSGPAVFGIFNKQPDLKNIHPKHYLWVGKL